MRRVYAASVIFLMLLSFLPLYQTASSAATTPSAPAHLSLNVAPLTLPADGGIYPSVFVSLLDSSGLPTLALTDVKVYLAVSNLDVGSLLNQSVVIPAGRNFAVAYFKTTGVPGVATISASATGLQPTSAKVTTAVPIGYPTRIVLSSVPSNVPSLPSYSGKIVVELEDQAGLPAKTVTDTVVQLSSSNTNILNVDSYVTVKAGQYTAIAGYVAYPVPGTASVTGTSSGYVPGSTSVTVKGPAALALKLYAMPSSMVTCSPPAVSCTGILVIAVTDLSGNPVHAPAPIVVQIRSTNTSIVNSPGGSFPWQTIIQRGAIAANTTFTATSIPGTATITVSASGLTSDYATITTTRAVGAPYSIRLYVAPASIPADLCKCGLAVVSFLNKTGYPTVDNIFTQSDNVTLTSSEAFVATFGKGGGSISLPVLQGNNFAWTTIMSTFVPGSTSLTASAQNRVHAVSQLTTTGPVPSKLVVAPLFSASGGPSQLPADGGQHPALEVALEDSSGNPVPAPSPNGIQVFVNSSRPGTLQVYSPVVIPPGRSGVLLNATTTPLAGSSNVTASVSCFPQTPCPIPGLKLSTSSIVTTVTPAPSQLAAILQPSSLLLSPVREDARLFVQLQDANGNPARARADTPITVTFSNDQVLNTSINVVIPQGADYVSVPLRPLAAGTTLVTVLSLGLATGSAQFTVLPSPFTAQLLASSLTILTNQTATLTLTVSLDGQGLQGVRVSWIAKNGNISPGVSSTGPNGQTSAVFAPSSAGLGKVFAIVTSPAIGTDNLTSVIYVVQAQPPKTVTLLQKILTFPYLLIPVAVAVIVLVLSLLLIRRRTRKPPSEEEAVEETQADFMYLGHGQSAKLIWAGTSS